jgi:hypothetical protein
VPLSSSQRLFGLGLTLCVGCGGQDLFVVGVLGKDADCEYTADESFTTVESYDIAPAKGRVETCQNAYIAHLLVDNDNDNDEDAVIESALVRVLTQERQTISFDRAFPLPNPFALSLAGAVRRGRREIVAIGLIPPEYGEQLEAFVGGELLIDLTLSARTAGGDEIGSNAVTVPVEICDGCRTFCASDPAAPAPDACDAIHRRGELCIDGAC